MQRLAFAAALLAASLAACGAPKETRTQEDFGFDGTCVRCHAGLHSGQVHPTYKLRCVDCHGGNDKVDAVPENASQTPDVYASPDLVKKSHVQPKSPALARFFLANGIDDDGDGQVDEPFEIADNDNDGKISAGDAFTDAAGALDFGEIAELGVQGEGIGQFIDSELNRDLNYTRWLNPGDLRVATASCGAASALAGGTPTGGCHQPVIDTVRRSIMASNGAVINGAFYGNESWRTTFQMARDAMGPASDPRKGAFGFTFAWDAIDSCITPPAADDPNAQPKFDSACLEDKAAAADPNAAADAPGNQGLPAFEATQGTIVGAAPGTQAGSTIEHTGVFKTRYPWGGKPLGDPGAALAQMTFTPGEELELAPGSGIEDPVDVVLRGFRAYYPLNFPGSALNFNNSFGEDIEPGASTFKFNNPFGRGHSSGCTACHMAYARDGARQPQKVFQVVDGKPQIVDVVDPTTKYREFDPATQDIVDLNGIKTLVGMTVNFFDRQNATPAGSPLRPQQRFYSESHTLTTAITTDTCGMCHSFVTRIDHSYRGMAEDEQRDAIARRAPLQFTTPGGTQVVISTSHVREEKDASNVFAVVDDPLNLGVGLDVIAKAKQRDADLAAQGFLPGLGGCVPDTFTEDCNNDGELETQLTLTAPGKDGKPVTTTINEDLNQNGKLDLVDRIPRERSVDGRQFKYIYGGRNGSTRLMDIHFEKGLHCIDCHFLQDTHGDGNIYSTNWDQIEIECEDCHGTLGAKATLVTSGQNGGNDLTKAVDPNGIPYFLKLPNGTVYQRSRVTPGLAWRVVQVDDSVTPGTPDYNPRAAAAMAVAPHMPDPVPAGQHTTGSTLENGKLKSSKLECYSCHNAWVYNCLGCHFQINAGDKVRVATDAAGAVTAVPGENEVWFNNSLLGAKTDFQLLEFERGPFVLGMNANADGNRLAPFRSSMEAHVSLNDANSNTLFDNITFTTFQAKDGNSGRANVATSGAAMNQTMPHTVRETETKDCDWCHAVVDQAGRITNDHILAQTMGLGTNRYAYTGDWILAAGANGLELYEIKKEHEQPGNKTGSNRFPGIIMAPNDADRVAANVEPILDGSLGVGAAFDATDTALLRNFNPAPAQAGQTAKPTLTDLGLFTLSNGTAGKLAIADITFRGHPTAAVRPSIGNGGKVFVLDLPGPALAMATISPDVSDPFVYIATGNQGLTVVRLLAPPAGGTAAQVETNVGEGSTHTAITLAGDVAYTGTAEGTIRVWDLTDPAAPLVVGDPVPVGGAVRAVTAVGFFLYVATDQGLAVLDIADPQHPTVAAGAPGALVFSGHDVKGLYVSGGHAYLACGAEGVLDVDVTVAAAPVELGNLAAGHTVDARDVIVSKVPGQTWLVVADASGAGGLSFIKLDNRLNPREACFPDPLAAGCGKDLDFRDPDIMGRDPSLDPLTGTPDAGDPSGPSFSHQNAAVAGIPTRLARPSVWEQIGTQTGRRMRDSFMPGSGVLSLEVMQRMRAVKLCVANNVDVDGNGVGELGYADDNFFNTGTCTPAAQ
jgi:hypothetical protein